MTGTIDLVKVFDYHYDEMNHHFEGYVYAVEGGFTLTVKNLVDGDSYSTNTVYDTIEKARLNFIMYEVPPCY